MRNLVRMDSARSFDYWLSVYAENRWSSHGYHMVRIGEQELLSMISSDPNVVKQQIRKVLGVISSYDVVHCGNNWQSYFLKYEPATYAQMTYQYWLGCYQQHASERTLSTPQDIQEIEIHLAGAIDRADARLAQERAHEILECMPNYQTDACHPSLRGMLRLHAQLAFDEKLYEYRFSRYREHKSPHSEMKLRDVISSGHPLLVERRIKKAFPVCSPVT